jgi:hypothetical protein
MAASWAERYIGALQDAAIRRALASSELRGFLKEFMTMQTKGKKLVVLLLGWGFVALGVVGLFLPVLQGMLFLLIGLFILSSEYVWAHRLLEKVRNRFPTAALRCEEASQKAHNWLGKVFRRVGSRPRSRLSPITSAKLRSAEPLAWEKSGANKSSPML